MLKSILFLISFSVLLIGNPESSVASGSSSTHPHTNALELKPASSLDNSFQIASVCFMGFGDCDPNAGFGKGDDYTPDIATKCTNEGYFLNNCGPLQSPTQYCPESNAFIKGCKCRDDLVPCANGQEGVGNSCGNKYTSCQCIQGVDNGIYGCKTYYPAPCNSSCKAAYTDNCHIRNDVDTPYECKTKWADCPSKCQIANANPDCDIAPKECPYECKTKNSCNKCTECKTNPDCNVTAASCDYGCQTTNSCNICTTCKGNPDCNVTSQTCNNGCASKNSCDKCTQCVQNKLSLGISWSAPSPLKLVVLYGTKNGGNKIGLGQMIGFSGNLEYTDIKVGDTLTITDGYGIVEGDPNGSDIQYLENQVTVNFSESRAYTTKIRLASGSQQPQIVPYAYVKEVYTFIGGSSSRYQEFLNILAQRNNTKLYTSYSNPEHRGMTTTGVDYSLQGPDETSLTFWHTMEPYAGVDGSGGGVAYCRINSMVRNGSNVHWGKESYTQIPRAPGEPQMTLVITYQCSII